MGAEIFISYKSEEEAYAREIRRVLEENGFSCWMAPDSIPSGSNYMKQIPQAIDGCRVMIVLVSEKSQESTWVKNEFNQAVTQDKLIIPYVIQNCDLKDEFRFSMGTMQQVPAWKDEKAALEKVVRDLREALGRDPDQTVNITIKPHERKNPVMVALIAAVLVLALVLGVIVLKPKQDSKPAVPAASASVYYSEVLPYGLTGAFATAAEAKDGAVTVPEYEKAFSILSFIRNPSDKAVFAEKIACEIEEVTPVLKPVLYTDGVLKGDELHVFLFNDGWKEAKDVQVNARAEAGYEVPQMPVFEAQIERQMNADIEGGGVVSLIDERIDLSELLAYGRETVRDGFSSTLYTVLVTAEQEGHPAVLAMYLYYDAETDSILCDYGGADDERPSVTLFGVLDVDNPPQEIRFTGSDAAPLIEDTYRIETVIIPTKSCQVRLRGSYLVDGQPFETETYDVRVNVPVFRDHSFTAGGALTNALAEVNPNDREQISRIIEQYRYDILSVLPSAG
ncbi:MAG: toll/interleukin-1 receptor domain-containing protein [Solobacterium sp.]|nr:toll/interleukin-1 receptor domain-containing protein [Solobacterium sp.]